MMVLADSGDEQQGLAGQELPEALVVQALDERGRAISGVVASFVVTHGGGSPWAGAANTNRKGFAREYWRLGDDPGENRMEVRYVDPSTGEKLLLHTFVAWGSLR